MLAEILGPDIFIATLLMVVVLGVPIWAIVDIASRPEAAFAAADASKTTWILLVVIFTLLCGIVGFVLAAYYLLVLRPRVAARA